MVEEDIKEEAFDPWKKEWTLVKIRKIWGIYAKGKTHNKFELKISLALKR